MIDLHCKENEVDNKTDWENPLRFILGTIKSNNIDATELKTQRLSRDIFRTEEIDHIRLRANKISIVSSSNEMKNKLSIV